jgi:ATP-binding cassette, subfamily C, bacterial CydD
MSDRTQGKAAIRAWLKREQREGRRVARPVVLYTLIATVVAVGQAACAAGILACALRGSLRDLAWLIAAFGGLACLRAWLVYKSDVAAFSAGAASRSRLRIDALDRMLRAGPAMLRSRHSADLSSVVVDRVEALDGLFGRWIPAATVAVAGPLIVLIAGAWADPFAGLVLLLCGLMVPVVMAVAGIGAGASSRRQFVALTRLQTRFLDRVRGIATIVLYGRAEDEARAMSVAALELGQRTMRVLRVAFLSSAGLDLAAALALIVLAFRYGAALLAGHLASPAMALFVLLVVPEFFAPLRSFAAAYQDKLHASTAAEALVDLPPLPPADAVEVREIPAGGVAVTFEDVRLTWDPERGPALDGLSFHVPAGESLTLTGPSGSGKSSAMEILLGFVRPDHGRVVVNGIDISDLKPQTLSRLTAWIGQRPVLFATTIADNIRFARPDAADDDVLRAADAAHVTSFATSLPNGMNTVIGEGGYGLSGGQAQRIAIARAFLKDAPLLLLDEPTAHLDPATEADVLESLRQLAAGRTVILAGHSAATRMFGGQRLHLQDGRSEPARGAA